MSKNNKSSIVIFFARACLIAIIISAAVFVLYNYQMNNNSLASGKIGALSRSNAIDEMFVFSLYPVGTDQSRASLVKDADASSGRILKFVFGGDNVTYSSGILFRLSLNIKPYFSQATVEFLIKGKKEYPLLNSLSVSMKEASGRQRRITVSVPIVIKQDWQKVSIPLGKFQLAAKDADFDWEINEILFSPNQFLSSEPAELYIKEIRILSQNRICYEFPWDL